MARPPIVTLALVVTASTLKGSNLWLSGFSDSLSGFLSCDYGASGVAATAAHDASAMTTAR